MKKICFAYDMLFAEKKLKVIDVIDPLNIESNTFNAEEEEASIYLTDNPQYEQREIF